MGTDGVTSFGCAVSPRGRLVCAAAGLIAVCRRGIRQVGAVDFPAEGTLIVTPNFDDGTGGITLEPGGDDDKPVGARDAREDRRAGRGQGLNVTGADANPR